MVTPYLMFHCDIILILQSTYNIVHRNEWIHSLFFHFFSFFNIKSTDLLFKEKRRNRLLRRKGIDFGENETGNDSDPETGSESD